MTQVKAWHANAVGMLFILGAGFVNSQTMSSSAESLMFGIALLGVGVVASLASVPATLLFLLGRLRRVAAVLNVLLAGAMVLFPTIPSLAFGGFLLVGAVLGWREAGQ